MVWGSIAALLIKAVCDLTGQGRYGKLAGFALSGIPPTIKMARTQNREAGMDWDEAERRKPALPKFETMSIEDLEDRIVALEAEIATIRNVIKGKQAARGSADSFFKK
jgi:uncharacterized small protein (DUF1192 family)